ncbi:hypothetical protein JXR74_02610 [Candidatus Mcinerneyibacteriota bacterium]|nr:hypothetical protein [Candidatus Mcinerneyibacteriota bacterium]
MFEKYGYQRKKIRQMSYLSRGILIAMAVAVGAYLYFRLNSREGAVPDILILGAFILFFPLMKYSRLFMKMSTTRFLLDEKSLTKLAPGGKREEILLAEVESVTLFQNGALVKGKEREMIVPSSIERYDDFVHNIEGLTEKKGEEKV